MARQRNIAPAAPEPGTAPARYGNGSATGRREVPPRLSVEAAHYVYGAREVLRGVDLEVAAGEIYGLLGPNGAGKTTLMRAISAGLALASGTVRINGRDPLKSRRARQDIGFVPQEIALFGHLTVRENLEVLGRFAGVRGSALRKIVGDVLEQAELADRADQLCQTLSGGYQRRVNICGSLLHAPDVLMLDEPTVGIDVKAREAVHRLLQRVRARGAAIVLTTHELDQAQELCDRVGIMVDGQLRVEGRPDVLLWRAFGTDKEILVTLAGAPDARQSAELERVGLVATSAPGVWFRRAEASDASATALLATLAEAGVAAKEVRVREPDLASLFVAVVGRSQEP